MTGRWRRRTAGIVVVGLLSAGLTSGAHAGTTTPTCLGLLATIVGTEEPDVLVGTNGALVSESVDTTAWTPVSGIDFPGGDSTVGQSGWRIASAVIDSSRLAGYDTIRIHVTDVGDTAYDSVGLVDGVSFS